MVKRAAFQTRTISQGSACVYLREAAREKALTLPPGAERDELLRKASQADTTAHLTDWVISGLLLPK